jgi:hypothetical protein
VRDLDVLGDVRPSAAAEAGQHEQAFGDVPGGRRGPQFVEVARQLVIERRRSVEQRQVQALDQHQGDIMVQRPLEDRLPDQVVVLTLAVHVLVRLVVGVGQHDHMDLHAQLLADARLVEVGDRAGATDDPLPTVKRGDHRFDVEPAGGLGGRGRGGEPEADGDEQAGEGHTHPGSIPKGNPAGDVGSGQPSS